MKNLSIVIPHYNSPRMLRRLLSSIPSNDDIEVVVIDDNSTDYMKEYETLMGDPKYADVLFLTNDSGMKGAGACRNIGMKHCTGKWILFADSDDYFVSKFFERVSRFFKEEYEVVFFTPTSIFDDTDEPADRHLNYERLIRDYLQFPNEASETRLRYNFVSPWSKLIRSEFLKKHNILFDEVIASNDVMFSIKVGHLMTNFKATRETIYCVTRSKGSLTVNYSPSIFDSRLKTFIKSYTYLSSQLNTRQFRYLNMSGFTMLSQSLLKGLGFRKAISVHSELRKHNVRIFDRRYLNPFFIAKKILHVTRSHISLKRFVTRH